MLDKLKVRCAGALCHPKIGAAISRVGGGFVSSNGYVFDTRSPAVDDRTRAMIWWSLYESAERRFVHRYLPSDLDVVELGGSLGIVSSHIARKLRPGQRFVSVEANPLLIELLRRNLTRNAPECRTEVIHAAIEYGRSSTVSFQLGASSLESCVGGESRGRETVDVPGAKLGALLDEHGVGFYTLVSDIEGAEAEVILKDPSSLERCRVMIIELHASKMDGCALSVQDLKEALLQQGFRLRESHGPVCAFEK